MAAIEIAAVLFGLLCVALTIRQHIACWPAGLAMVTLYIFIFYEAKLYSDMLLQVVYIFLQIYGWWAWARGGPRQSPLPVTEAPPRELGFWLTAGVLATAALGSAMRYGTDASFPYVDAFTTISSLIAQWLLARKRLQSWLVWIVVDVVSVGLYFAKDLYLTAGLYFVFLFLAILGYTTWKASLRDAASG